MNLLNYHYFLFQADPKNSKKVTFEKDQEEDLKEIK